MPATVEFPTVVQDAVKVSGSVFANEPERRHLAECLKGLFVAEKKNGSIRRSLDCPQPARLARV